MSTKIYWFSGTGNSLSVAKTLHQTIEDSELISMAQAVDCPLESADRIGLVFPVYGFGPPRLVERFIRRLRASSCATVFAVVTYAGNPGDTLEMLRRLLRQRGLELAGGWGVKMPENYPPMGGAPAPDKQRRINGEAAQAVERIARELTTPSTAAVEKPLGLWRVLSRVANPGFRRFAPRADRWFRTDERCNGCGVCQAVCPVGNIRMENGRPIWQGHCEQCFACLHWCPQEAVGYLRSKGQPRYHHPQTDLGDFMS